MRILFWNISNSAAAAELLPALVCEQDVSVLVLAESNNLFKKIAETISSKSARRYFPDPIGANKRLTWFSVFPWQENSHIEDDRGISIKEFFPPIGNSLTIAGVHAASQLYKTPEDLSELMHRHAKKVRQAESKLGHDRTVVIGDFNLNPFDKGLISSESFHAVMDRRIAEKESRVVQEKSRAFFYNPMWSLYGQLNESGFLGSYKYYSSSSVELFWHCFDQALIRPCLLSRTGANIVKFVGKVESISLFDVKKQKILYSDHLPLLLEIKDI
jgi:exonuclease III